MPGSIGPVKIPLISTFDPRGINEAKSALQGMGGGAAEAPL